MAQMPKPKPDRTPQAKRGGLRRLVYMPLDSLKPADWNPKKHSEADIAASIARWGFTAPIELDERTGKLVAGHGRRDVLLMLRDRGDAPPDGIQPTSRRASRGGDTPSKTDWKVPVLRGWSSKDDAEAEAYILASNQTGAKGGWDDDLLAAYFKRMFESKGSTAGTGFSDKDISMIMKRSPIEIVQDESPPVPKNPVTRAGDLWICGEHRLLCGDSTKRKDVQLVMDGEVAHIVVTDPPYGVAYKGGTTERKKLVGDETADLYAPVMKLAAEFTDSKSPVYLWHSDSKSAAVSAAGYERRCTIIWNKNQAQFGALGAQYKTKHEPCLYLYKRGKSPRWFGPTNEVSVWDEDRNRVNENHPTEKPIALMMRCLRNSSEAGNIAIDFFLGSGTTMVACENLGRKCRGIEIGPDYCDVAVKRWQDLSGKRAVNETRPDVTIA